MTATAKLKVSWPRLLAILEGRGWNRQTLIDKSRVSESTLDRIQRGETSNENTVRRLESALAVERTAFLEKPPESQPLPNQENGMSQTPKQSRRFAVALSFAGDEHRDYVLQVAEHLANHVGGKNKVLYDRWYEHEFGRFNLASHLSGLYQKESDLVAVFLGKEYRDRPWCGLEWNVVLGLILSRRTDDVMLLRFDDTEIEGLPPSHGAVWIGTGSAQRPASEIADLIAKRWSGGQTTGAGETGPGDEGPVNSVSALQKELARLLHEHHTDADLMRFIAKHRPGASWQAYFAALCKSTEPYKELLRLRLSVQAWLKAGKSPAAQEALTAIALSALVLYEVYHRSHPGEAIVAAENLLAAAVQAGARLGTDAAVGAEGILDRSVDNAFPTPGNFLAYRKDGENEPEQEEIRRALNLHAEATFLTQGELSYRAIRRTFEHHARDIAEHHAGIDDDELRDKLDIAAEALKGRPTFFVPLSESNDLLARHETWVKETFAVPTVRWKQGKEPGNMAPQLEEILHLLFPATRAAAIENALPDPDQAADQSAV